MAKNERFMPVPPAAVWAVLARAGSYGYWVVGSKYIRDADADFPAVGTKLHHTIGFGPLTLSDHTEVLEAEPGRRLKLRAKGRPLGTASIELELEPVDGGTRVRIIEDPDQIYTPLKYIPLVQLATRVRNAETLMRLEDLALREAE
ncbi:SRPBCC family protein [Solirubrobacter sp. CPCC 204708]|uniref:SRPBCC family protein n=1 Tax=Solirubrobacter deserti TaxID=2282478 RepID=A0ABT4RDB9_9ACTN|nr:SRPBCC family protein [Solirubrobacter deserti]MBE2314530.1 SRPBCC family protein [Solirubrobacter deserti]MDA0136534.1 SRPBCC family protein [Solirubrobacter deserti]